MKLLEEVSGAAGADFSGVGVIVAASIETLPIIALRPTSKPNVDTTTSTALAEISHPWHEYHDGFHVLTPELKIERVAQYFSPPIVSVVHIDRQKRFGGRYLAALFGSLVPGVLITGIASRHFGVAVFCQGVESYYRTASETPFFTETTCR